MTLPTQAKVVIIGGGIMGCSTAYHLGKNGFKDVVLLEQPSVQDSKQSVKAFLEANKTSVSTFARFEAGA